VASGRLGRWRLWSSGHSAIGGSCGAWVALAGVVLGTLLFLEINRHAPDDWGWSAGWAAWLMQADTLQTGYKVIDSNNPGVAAAVNEDIRLGNAYAGALHACEAAAAQASKEQRCALSVPPPNTVKGNQADGNDRPHVGGLLGNKRRCLSDVMSSRGFGMGPRQKLARQFAPFD
jgi:hypothetical protein